MLQIYSGSDTQFRDSGLEPKTEYTIRVCGVRVPVPETELAGPYSPPAIFTTLSADGSGVSGSGNIATTKRVTSSGTNIVQHVSDFFPWNCNIFEHFLNDINVFFSSAWRCMDRHSKGRSYCLWVHHFCRFDWNYCATDHLKIIKTTFKKIIETRRSRF